MAATSMIWKYFVERSDIDKAECQVKVNGAKCVKLLYAKGKTTSSLINHLNNIHKDSEAASPASPDSSR